MKKKHIDALHEARLWIGQVIVPAINMAMTAKLTNEVKNTVAAKCDKVIDTIRNNFEKKETTTAYYTKAEWDYIQEVARRKDNNELSAAEWEAFKREWMI